MNINRRRWIKLSGQSLLLSLGALFASFVSNRGLLPQAVAEDPPRLKTDDPTASALGYVEVSKKSGQDCAKCLHYKAIGKKKVGTCAIFQSKSVPAGGWCSAFAVRQ